MAIQLPAREMISAIRTQPRRLAQTKISRFLFATLFSSAVGFIAYRRHSLSRSGVVGAIITGTTTVGFGGWPWGLSLIYFFVSSSLFSHFKAQEKTAVAADKFSKGGERDIGQVAANGGVATLLALGTGLTASLSMRKSLQAAYAGALATATADTWATELGVLSPQSPRLITTGKPVSPGTSGGITLFGTGAAALGAFSSGIVFWLLAGCKKSLAELPLLSLFSGLAGSIADSLLGATVQAMYYCPVCDKETERSIHSCGTPTVPLRGIPWLDNDIVNGLATLVGSLAAMGLHDIVKLNGRSEE